MLGAVPLAIGFGQGAELRRPLGMSIVGGLIVSQFLTLYTTPVVYLYLDRFRLWGQRCWRLRRLHFRTPIQTGCQSGFKPEPSELQPGVYKKILLRPIRDKTMADDN